MEHLYDVNATKRASNVSVNADLLSKARALKINLSATLERALVDELRKAQAQQWLRENKEAIAAYNKHVDEVGVFGEGLRAF